MGAEKGGKRAGGFFHIFDWNRKSRKKLFTDEAVSLEGTARQVKQNHDNLQTTRFHIMDNENIVGVSSFRGGSDCSRASSVTDEGENGIRGPGVVARLMGLDPMPLYTAPETYSTPVFDSQYLRDNYSLKRSSESYTSDKFTRAYHKNDGYGKPMESRSQRMPSSPIEKFQRETMPSTLRFPRALPLTHHKLLSPIKNPGFISAQNAAHIMEAAAKIFEPALQTPVKSKVSKCRSSSFPPKVCASRENSTAPMRASKLYESSKTQPESTSSRSLRRQPLNRSWNGLEDTSCSMSSLDSANPAGKGKSISLAVQAKVNVQKRGGLGAYGGNMSVEKEREEIKLNQAANSLPNNNKDKQQGKPPVHSSGVLKQNNQKQNCMRSREKSAPKPSILSQRGRKTVHQDASSQKGKTVNKVSVNCRHDPRKEGLDSTSDKNTSRRKRSIVGGGLCSETRDGIHAQRNVLINEHSKWKDGNGKSGVDVVSFTFTSPMTKPMHGSRSTQVLGGFDGRTASCDDTHCKKRTLDEENTQVPNIGCNMINDDALSILLEQKLKELMGGSPCGEQVEAGRVALASSLEEPISCSNASWKHEFQISSSNAPGKSESQFRSSRIGRDHIVSTDVSSTSSQKLREVEHLACRDSSSSTDELKKLGHDHSSPLSILEASFSNETCNSSESLGSTDGINISASSVQAQNVTGLSKLTRTPLEEAEWELNDSASSALVPEAKVEEHASKTNNENACRHDLLYVEEILSNESSACKSLGLHNNTLDPLLFEKLETKDDGTRGVHGEDKECRMRRKVLFDCVNECLEQKYSRYMQGGYRTWCKGRAMAGKELAEEVYKEISSWKTMGDWMVDELVDRDMSSHLGKWTDFEVEAFEEGVEIEKDIFSSLIDEMVADLLIKGQFR